MLEDFEGLALVTLRKATRKTRMVKRRQKNLFRDEAETSSDDRKPNADITLPDKRQAGESENPNQSK